jgi:hypothetical protein
LFWPALDRAEDVLPLALDGAVEAAFAPDDFDLPFGAEVGRFDFRIATACLLNNGPLSRGW